MADLGAIGTWRDGPYRNNGLTVRRVPKTLVCSVIETFPFGGRNNTEGDPAQPSLQITSGKAKWRFRWIVAAGARTLSIKVKQQDISEARPTLIVKANPDIGVNADVTETAPAGDGWVTIGPAAITPSSDGAVWVEIWNNVDGLLPAYFDNVQQS
jgi:hypothetical protein